MSDAKPYTLVLAQLYINIAIHINKNKLDIFRIAKFFVVLYNQEFMNY